MEKVIIEKLDNQGKGICYINNKITFVNNALPGEIVNIEIVKENKKYNEAIVKEYIEKSSKRRKAPCKYFGICGGCELLHSSYEDTLKYKKDKLKDILSKYANIDKEIEIIPSNKEFNYRNKITLKIENKRIGYYEKTSHTLVEIDKCLLVSDAINNLIKDIKYFNINNGEIVIRSNYNNELLIIIKSKDEIKPDIEYLKSRHKIVGIILNNKIINGDDKFIEVINHLLFQVSYDSFFQVNREICSKLFTLVKKEITKDSIVLDLYCGVGTLGINVSDKAKRVYAIEIVKNAILNGISNSKINKRDNIYFMLGDTKKCLPKIKEKVDIVMVDPPRAGLDKEVTQNIIELKPKKIIYISCDPMTLARDLKVLKEFYNIKKIYGLDMFPYTKHIECVCLLYRKTLENKGNSQI